MQTQDEQEEENGRTYGSTLWLAPLDARRPAIASWLTEGGHWWASAGAIWRFVRKGGRAFWNKRIGVKEVFV